MSQPDAKTLANRKRQAEWRERQKKLGRTNVQWHLTEDEAFYLRRVLDQMRRDGSVPAMMRNQKGQLEPCDI